MGRPSANAVQESGRPFRSTKSHESVDIADVEPVFSPVAPL